MPTQPVQGVSALLLESLNYYKVSIPQARERKVIEGNLCMHQSCEKM